MLVSGRLREQPDRIETYDGSYRRHRDLRCARNLVQLQCGTMLGIVVVSQMRQFKRDQLAAFEGTDDNLLTVAIMGDDRCDQVGKHRLKQEASDQQPGDHCTPGSGSNQTAIHPDIPCSHNHRTIGLQQTDLSLSNTLSSEPARVQAGAIVSANPKLHKQVCA